MAYVGMYTPKPSIDGIHQEIELQGAERHRKNEPTTRPGVRLKRLLLVCLRRGWALSCPLSGSLRSCYHELFLTLY